MSDERCPFCCGELSYCGEPADDGNPTIDCVYCKQRREIERLRELMHHIRGLLETAVDAYECGHWNGLLCMKQLHLTQAWWDEARKAGGSDAGH